jgi:hypothetical protein
MDFFSAPVEFLTKIFLDPSAKEAAYLDPGSGSFILQLLIASAVGIGFALRGYWSKIIGLFTKSSDVEETSEEETPDGE